MAAYLNTASEVTHKILRGFSSNLAPTAPRDARLQSEIQSDISKKMRKATFHTLTEITGSGNNCKQGKPTGGLTQKIPFTTKYLAEKRGLSLATKEQFQEFSVLVCLRPEWAFFS